MASATAAEAATTAAESMDEDAARNRAVRSQPTYHQTAQQQQQQQRESKITAAHKLAAWHRSIALERAWHLLGRAVAAQPVAFIIASAIMALLSLGMCSLELRDRLRDGYTPSTSRSRLETDVYRDFLGAAADPSLTTVLVRARDGSSMHGERQLKATVDLLEFLSKNLTAEMDDGEKTIRYSDFCGSYCSSNAAISYFYLALTERYQTAEDRRKAKESPLNDSNILLTHPISNLAGYELHLERNFFGVRLRSTPDPANVTWIEHVELISMTFTGDVRHPDDQKIFAAWEMAAYNFIWGNPSSLLDVQIIGAEIVDLEMNRDAQKMTPYFATGFSAMILFVGITVFASSYALGALTSWTAVIAIASTLVPVLAITSTLGLTALLGMRTNSLMLIMPFLIMGIGVNDAFLMIHSWLRQSPTKVDDRLVLANVFQEVGPSITITTLTNVITFGVGALTPTPEISIFCWGTAAALGLAYIFTLTLFGPLLQLAGGQGRKRLLENGHHLLDDDGGGNAKPRSRGREKLARSLRKALKVYCRILRQPATAILLFLSTLVYWHFGVLGTLHIDSKLDTGKILPVDSPIRLPNALIEKYLWNEFYPLHLLVNQPVDIRRKKDLNELNALVESFERMPTCKGAKFTTFWLRDYIYYKNHVADFEFDFYDDPENDTATTKTSTETGLDFDGLDGFLRNPKYSFHRAFLKLDNSSEVRVRRFSLLFAYVNTSNWSERIDLTQKWRHLAAANPRLNATIWDVNSMFVDQMLSLKSVAFQTGLWTLVCMAAVCAVFIQNPVSVCTATLCIASISLGTTGYLSWWHLDLDPVSLCAVLMSVGMSVDFTAHTCYHYQAGDAASPEDDEDEEEEEEGEGEKGGNKKNRRSGKYSDEVQARLERTIANVAWPMLQAGLSTVICILPLVMLQNYIPLVFVKTISLVVIWGLWHGLVLLPAALAQIPTKSLDINCWRVVLSRHTSKADGVNNDGGIRHLVMEPEKKQTGGDSEMQPLQS